MAACPSTNTADVEQDSFWDFGNRSDHETGWIVAGASAALTVSIVLTHVIVHLRSYYVPREQRQIIRVLLLPAVYGVVSFFSYRYFRSFYYYELAYTAYEALAIAAFLYLILEYVGEATDERRQLLLAKDKKKLPLPLCCFRFRPGKPYFIWLLKWAVLQYVFFRPAISIIGIICEAYNVLCPTHYSVHFAEVYLEAADFVLISIALYGLLCLYFLVKDNLKGRKPLAKFLSIKAVVFLTFFQGFVFSVLADHGVIKATKYWTTTNIADGLQALAICLEGVLFSSYNWWAFSPGEYRRMRQPGEGHTSVWKSFLHSQNYWDFIREFGLALAFFWAFIRRKPGTRRASIFDMQATFQGQHVDGEKLYYKADGSDLGTYENRPYNGRYAQPVGVESRGDSYAETGIVDSYAHAPMSRYEYPNHSNGSLPPDLTYQERPPAHIPGPADFRYAY